MLRHENHMANDIELRSGLGLGWLGIIPRNIFFWTRRTDSAFHSDGLQRNSTENTISHAKGWLGRATSEMNARAHSDDNATLI